MQNYFAKHCSNNIWHRIFWVTLIIISMSTQTVRCTNVTHQSGRGHWRKLSRACEALNGRFIILDSPVCQFWRGACNMTNDWCTSNLHPTNSSRAPCITLYSTDAICSLRAAYDAQWKFAFTKRLRRIHDMAAAFKYGISQIIYSLATYIGARARAAAKTHTRMHTPIG